MTELSYVRNNLDGKLDIPFGREMVTFAAGLNGIPSGLLDKITSGFGPDGKAKGGRAAVYFNHPRPKLQMAHAPIGDDPCNIIKAVPGVRKDRRGRRVQKERDDKQAMQEKLAALTAMVEHLTKGKAEVEPSEPLLDPSDYTIDDLAAAIDGLDADELYGVLKLERTRAGGARAGAEKLLLDAI